MVPSDPVRPGRRRRRGALALAAAALALAACAGEEAVEAGAPRTARNLLLVSIDTCRADHLSAYGYERETSPALAALAARGVLCANAFAQVPDTTPSHASLFTSTYPLEHGSANGVPLSGAATTLAETLGAAGFRTAGFVSSATMSARQSGLSQGFETWDDELTHDPQGIGRATERRGADTAARALEWLEGAGEAPFFLFVHFFDPHTRYDPPPPYDRMFVDGARPGAAIPEADLPPFARIGDATDAAFYAARYDGELRYVDDQLARLLAALEARGLDEDTLVVVTSDHGEDMGEHGVWFSHGWTLFDPALHVPLVLALPGGLPEGRRYEDLVQSVDVLPTVLALLGREHGAPTQGRDLRALLAGDVPGDEPFVLAKTTKAATHGAVRARTDFEDFWALRTARHKLMYSEGGARKALFDLASDPGERADVLAAQPAAAAELMRRLRAQVYRLEPLEADPRAIPGQREVEALTSELRALGYVR